MVDLEFLKAKEEHRAALSYIWAHVYGNGIPPEEAYSFNDGETPYLVTQNGEFAWAAVIVHYNVWRAGVPLAQPWSCGGVGSVATLTEYRNKGVSSLGMRGLLKEMFAEGKIISSLYPFRESYYRKFGYATCGYRWSIRVPTHRLPTFACDLPVRRVMPRDHHLLHECHTAMVKKLSGSPVRSPELWERRLGTKPPMILAIGDPIEAYFWASPKEFWGTLEVGEFAWSTPRGYEAALEVLRGLASNQSFVTWPEPPDSLFLSQHVDQGVEANISRPTMFRVIDVAQLVSTLPYPDHPVVIEIDDPDLPENRGPWRIYGGPHGCLCQPTTETPDLKMSIHVFSQLAMGNITLAQLQQGLVEIRNLRALKELVMVLPQASVCCMEFF
ncbi:MAG: GNAT family N-acetyltransferase [Fimbriimonadaceae bacterium]|jgi:predicted acetyltransferase|nr:GNAT family N-acetyltransferase [Fimbriimonadaceae bacterium]